MEVFIAFVLQGVLETEVFVFVSIFLYMCGFCKGLWFLWKMFESDP